MTDADRVVGLTPGDPEPVVRDLQAVIDAATAAALPTIVEPGQVAAFVVPPGGGLAYLSRDTDEDRRREGLGPAISQAGTTVVRDESAIVTLAERWGHPQSVLVYADAVSRKVTAVLDDDPGGGQYGWRDRRVQLDLVHTPEWVRWAAIDGKLLSQVDFAEHVEACLEDIRSPSAADMLEIAQTLEATVDVTFRSGVRLRDGQR
ncbi:MAG TPA: DUF2303 family protein, partial [Candidatus Limnocylindrales bacterium]